MTEYTPTTEEVRRCYGDIHCSDLSAGTLDWHECPEEAEFDRWLNEIRAEAWDEGWERSIDFERSWRFAVKNGETIPQRPRNPHREG